MILRLNIVVEGQTEETFIRRVLAPHLGALGIAAVARSVETSRRQGRIYRGGVVSYTRVKGDLERWMKQDRASDAWFTTMIDLYGIARLASPFPALDDTRRLLDPYHRVARLEDAFAEDVMHPRFIPYLQLHEFEALLLARPEMFDWEFLDHDKAIGRLIDLASSHASPELIDDEAPPSYRIIQEIPEYAGRKTSAGPLVAEKIGLDILRRRCTHFGEWLRRLESLSVEA